MVELSEIFWMAFLTTMTGFTLKLASMAYKSKCKKCSACGITIERDIEAEVGLEEFKALHPTPSTNNSSGDLTVDPPASP